MTARTTVRRTATLWSVIGVGCLFASACIGGAGTRDDSPAEITVFGPYRSTEADRFVASVEAFTERTGITIRYTGSADFVADLERRAGERNDPPDVAIVPQPGVIRELAADARIAELSDSAHEQLAANYSPEARALGEVDGTAFAVPFRANIKSLVWYRPSVFSERGWETPSSLDELEALVARIQADGEMAPWCLALESGTTTGWPATDWAEDLVLRLAGQDDYDRWAKGQLPFSSATITEAFTRFRELVLAPGRLNDTAAASVEIPVRQVVDPLFGDLPACAMAKQADFSIGWMPTGTVVGPDGDVDFFVLPDTMASEDMPPLVVGSDLAVQFSRSPDIDAFMSYLAEDQVGEEWANQGGFLSPKTTFDPAAYPNDAQRRLAELLTSASTLAFDASDQMPASIGSGLLWEEISAWVAGAEPYDAFSARIDEAIATLDSDGSPSE